MVEILYISAAIIAAAFFYLVVSISKTLRSVQHTLNSVAGTLEGLERQMVGITTETTELLHKTNILADDIQRKAEALNTVVDSVKDVGHSIQNINSSIKNVSHTVSKRVEANQETVAQVVQWSNVAFDIWDKLKARRKKLSNLNDSVENGEEIERSRVFN